MQRGLTLVEVVISVAILAIVAMGLTSAYVTAQAWSDLTEERVAASNAIRTQLEAIYASQKGANGLDSLLATYATPADGGTQGEENRTYDIDELNGTLSTAIFLNESRVPAVLGGSPVTYTDSQGNEYGPMDLNGDGDTDDDHGTPVNGVYGTSLAPVEITVRWNVTDSETMEMRRYALVARVDE